MTEALLDILPGGVLRTDYLNTALLMRSCILFTLLLTCYIPLMVMSPQNPQSITLVCIETLDPTW